MSFPKGAEGAEVVGAEVVGAEEVNPRYTTFTIMDKRQLNNKYKYKNQAQINVVFELSDSDLKFEATFICHIIQTFHNDLLMMAICPECFISTSLSIIYQ